MMFMKKIIFYLIFLSTALQADSKYPADISYMVADLKYSQEHGVKICEVQHGILSTFLGDVFLNGGDGLLCPQIAEVFAEFPAKKWMVPTEISFAPLLASFQQSSKWKKVSLLELLIHDPAFTKIAKKAPKDPYSLSSYRGMVYTRPASLKKIGKFKKNYPGVLVIDAATHPYWIDKYLMTLLFTKDPELAQIKPEWGMYAKTYTNTLAEQIAQEIPAEAYVIKPRGAFLGDGVIIVSQADLEKTLKYILTPSSDLSSDKDHSFSYWAKDPFDSFLVEKYYPSDAIPIDALGGKMYEPTMRVAFVMMYNNKKIDCRFLGGYWLLPHMSLDEQGSLNQIKKAHCKPPFFVKVPDDVLTAVQGAFERGLPLLYQQMLEQRFVVKETLNEKTNKRKDK